MADISHKIAMDGRRERERMTLRTKGEQKAYLDGFEVCAECIEKYLTNEGKQKLECLVMAVRNAVEIEDIEPQNADGGDAE